MACRTKMRKLSVGGILSSTATGATAGSVVPGYGTAVGAVAGFGVGVYKHIKEEKAIDLAEKQRREALVTQRNTQRQSNFNNNLQQGYSNIPLLPLGGLIPYNEETVELENGESFQTPDGNINKIPNGAATHAQGGVPITLPSGTKVLGKKPATDEKTFKELGSKLERQQTKYQKILDNKPSRIEEQTANRMLNKISVQFNELFTLQGEDIQPVQQFQDGGLTGDPAIDSTFANYRPQSIRTQEYGDFDKADYGDLLSSKPLYAVGTDSIIATENRYKGVPGIQYGLPGDTGGRIEKYTTSEGEIRFAGSEQPKKEFSKGGMIRKGQYGLQTGFGADNDYRFGISDPYDPTSQYAPQLQDYSNQVQYNPRVGGRQSFTPYDVAQPQVQQGNTLAQGQGFNVGNALSTAASLAPVAYNLYQGLQKPDQIATNAFRNPYESEVRATMRGRRYNVQPEIEAARLSEATYYRNLRESAPSQSQYLGGLQAGAIGTQRAIGQTLARKQNVDNQYLAQQAQTDLALGQADVQRQQYIENINARSSAAQRQFTSTGLTQLGQFAQVRQQQNNQMIRDAQRLNLLPALVQNFTLNEQGQWTFKQTGEVVDDSAVEGFIKGQNIQ